MVKETLTYEIQKEIRRGPWGLIRRRETIGQLPEGSSSTLLIGTGQVRVTLESQSQALIIRSDEQPVTVEFGAEPQRFRPKVVAKLNEPEVEVHGITSTIYPGSEIRTGRRTVTIYPSADSSQRLVLEAPQFQPMILSNTEVVLAVTGTIINERFRAMRQKH